MKINKGIRILLVADTIWFFGEGMLGPLFAVFAERIGGDIFDITWAWATYLIVTGGLIMLIGKISDKKALKKEHLVTIGYILNAVFTFGYLLVSAPIHLFIVQIGLGISAALATPTWNALYAKHEDSGRTGLEWGLADGAAQIFSGIAIILGGIIVGYFSFDLLFIVMGSVQVVAAFSMYQINTIQTSWFDKLGGFFGRRQ